MMPEDVTEFNDRAKDDVRFLGDFFLGGRGGGRWGGGGSIHYHNVIIHVNINTDYGWFEKQTVCHPHLWRLHSRWPQHFNIIITFSC